MVGEETVVPSRKPQQTEAAVAGETEGSLREVKVKLPVKQVLGLHYARILKGQNFSQIVSTALTRYFEELNKP